MSPQQIEQLKNLLNQAYLLSAFERTEQEKSQLTEYQKRLENGEANSTFTNEIAILLEKYGLHFDSTFEPDDASSTAAGTQLVANKVVTLPTNALLNTSANTASSDDPLLHLRALQQLQPTLDDLESYAGKLTRLAGHIQQTQPESPEARQAVQDAGIASRIAQHYRELVALRTRSATARDSLNLRESDAAYKAVIEKISQIEKLDYSRFTLVKLNLLGLAKQIGNETQKDRDYVGIKTGNPATMAAQKGLHDTIADLIQRRDGVGLDKPQEESTNPAGAVVNINVAITDWTTEYLKWSKNKINEKIRLIKDKLGPNEPNDLLNWASNTINEVLKFFDDKYVGSGLRASEDHDDETGKSISLSDKVGRTEADIKTWLDKRESSRIALKNAIEKKNPIEGLDVLRGEVTYPKLSGISEARTLLRAKAVTEAQKLLGIAADKVVACQANHTYEQDLEASTAMGAIDQLWLELGREKDIEPNNTADWLKNLEMVQTNLKSLRDTMTAEAQKWKVFEPKYKDLRKQAEDGEINENNKQALLEKFTPEEKDLFVVEWNDIENLVAKSSGPGEQIRRAKTLLDRNPTDPQIPNVLSGSFPDGQKPVVEDILRRHRTWVGWKKLRAYIENMQVLETNPRSWLNELNSYIDQVTADATDSEKGLKDQAKALHEQAVAMSAVQTTLNTDFVAGKYKKGFNGLKDQRNQAAKEGKYDLADAYELMIQQTRRRWRAARKPALDALVDSWSAERDRLSLSVAQKCAAYIDELEEDGALFEDGDGLLADKIRQIYHARAVEDMLGRNTHVENLTEQDLANFADRFPNFEWEKLHMHLLGLANYGLPDNDEIRTRALILTEVTRCLQAIRLEPQEGIGLIKTHDGENEKLNAWLNPATAVTLTLLHLSQARAEIEAARQVVTQLEKRGAAKSVVKALTGMVEVTERAHDDADIEKALAELKTNIERFQQYAADLATQSMNWYSGQIRTSVAGIASKWKDSLGRRLLDEAKNKDNSNDPFSIFEVVRLLGKAQELLDDKALAQAERKNRAKRLGDAAELLLDKIDTLLNKTPTGTLKILVVDTEKYLDYLKEIQALPKNMLPDRVKNTNLDNLKDQLKARSEVWDKAWKGIQKVRGDICKLLISTWDIDADPKNEPLKAIGEAVGEIGTIANFSGLRLTADEIVALDQFVINFRRNIQNIGPDYGKFKPDFVGDKYTTNQKIYSAQTLLNNIKESAEKADLMYMAHRAALGDGSPNFTFKDHFRVQNSVLDAERLGATTSLMWDTSGAVEDSTNLIHIEDWLNRRIKSAEDWHNWCKDAKDYIEKVRDLLGQANTKLKGMLSKAEDLCRPDGDIEIAIAILVQQQTKLENMEPPYGKFALAESRSKTFDDNTDFNSLERFEVLRAWADCIENELTSARKKLGPGNQAGNDTSLRGRCASNRDKLMMLLSQMDRHVRVFKVVNSNVNTQKAYFALLDDAEAIDRENEKVKSHRSEYDRRQKRLEGNS